MEYTLIEPKYLRKTVKVLLLTLIVQTDKHITVIIKKNYKIPADIAVHFYSVWICFYMFYYKIEQYKKNI